MTKEEWTKVETALGSIYGRAELLIDGYNVSVVCIPEKPLHQVLMVYINGEFKTKWCLEDCEERRRFCFKSKKVLLNSRQRAELKREKKSIQEAVKKQMTTYAYYPFWNSLRTLKSHFIKNNSSIELVRCSP